MTTIWMDPIELDSVAGALNDQVARLRGAVEGVRSTCSCAAPPALAHWLQEELDLAEKEGVLSALLYALAGLDIAVRAQELSREQSLAASVSGPGVDLAAALAGSTTVGGTGPGFSVWNGGTQVNPGAVFPTATIGPITTGALGLGGAGLAASMIASDAADFHAKTWLAPSGTSYEGKGIYSDDYGRTGSLGSLFKNPKTGDYEVM